MVLTIFGGRGGDREGRGEREGRGKGELFAGMAK